jgi:CheY-like chemotaxis protein
MLVPQLWDAKIAAEGVCCAFIPCDPLAGKIVLYVTQTFHHARTKVRPMQNFKVLVIDDNEAHAEGLAELLELSGFDCTSVSTGLDGLDMAERLAVDAVLLNMDLPDIEGLEVCRRLRSNPVTTNVAVIFHTGSSPSPGMEHDADSFLTYPVAIRELSVVIQGCVARRKGLL